MAMRRGYVQAAEHVRKRMVTRLATLAAKPKPVSREWLERRYVTERRDCVQIARELGRDPKTVWAWMRHYGIATRPRGGATSPHAFQPGSPSLFTGHRHTDATRRRLREIALADGRVPFDPRVGPPFRGKRGAATPNWKGGVTPERQALYASDACRGAVKAVWARADARCERCGTSHNTAHKRGTFHVHHIVSFATVALRAEVSNLALVCRACHHFIHSRRNHAGDFLKEAPHGCK